MKTGYQKNMRERKSVTDWALVFFIENKNGTHTNPTRLPHEPEAWIVVLFSVTNWAGQAQSNDQPNKMGKLQCLRYQGPRSVQARAGLSHLYKRVKGNGLASKKFAKPLWAKPTNHHLHICTIQSRWIQPKKACKKKIYLGAFFFWVVQPRVKGKKHMIFGLSS